MQNRALNQASAGFGSVAPGVCELKAGIFERIKVYAEEARRGTEEVYLLRDTSGPCAYLRSYCHSLRKCKSGKGRHDDGADEMLGQVCITIAGARSMPCTNRSRKLNCGMWPVRICEMAT